MLVIFELVYLEFVVDLYVYTWIDIGDNQFDIGAALLSVYSWDAFVFRENCDVPRIS